MRREIITKAQGIVLGLPRKFHVTITFEQALKLELVMVQEAAKLVGKVLQRPRKNNNIEKRYSLAESERQEADEMADDNRRGTVLSRCVRRMHV
tara:strand:+ start:708 stop:989 length:282 start_codon:yes stop_codon:yes gene_type:complete